MATQTWRLVGLLIAVLVITTRLASAQPLERFSFAEPHLGTIIEITLYAPEENAANEGARAAFARVKELDQILSDYKSDSEVMRLCDQAGTGKPIKVSPELFGLLQRSLAISEQSDGAFDITIGPLVQLWRRSRKSKILPKPDEVAAAKELVNWKLISLNTSEQTVELQRSGMRLDFGGIAKGYISQEVSRRLRDRGIDRSLVAVAGDIVAGEPPPNSEGWKIGIAPLDQPDGRSSRLLLLKNQAVSTSGDAFQFVQIGHVRYSHIVDPSTGIGLTRRSSCTVIARDGATADALATAVCVLGPERGLKLIENSNNTAALIVQATEDGTQVLTSSKFCQHEANEKRIPSALDPN